MEKFNKNKTVLITIGFVTIIFGIIASMTSGSLLDQPWILILGIAIVVIAFSLDSKTE